MGTSEDRGNNHSIERHSRRAENTTETTQRADTLWRELRVAGKLPADLTRRRVGFLCSLGLVSACLR